MELGALEDWQVALPVGATRTAGPGTGGRAGNRGWSGYTYRIAASVNPSSALKYGSPSASLSPPTVLSYCENDFLMEEHRLPVLPSSAGKTSFSEENSGRARFAMKGRLT